MEAWGGTDAPAASRRGGWSRLHASTPSRLLLCVLLAPMGCALEEVTIPLGREVLVVQGVMTLDSTTAAQYIVVERSLTGTINVPDQDSLRAPPRPPLPESGALVVVTRDDGDSVTFFEIPDTLGVYRLDSVLARPFFTAGRVYALRVRVLDGRVVAGRMRMPDYPVVSGIPPDGASFNRDHDTLRVTWSGGGASKGVFVQVRPRDIERRLTLFFFTDSARFRVAGPQPLPFVDDDKPPAVWIPGTRQTFTVAAVDTNLFEFTRSGNDPFTGSGFINTLTGALGVFGGVAPVNRTYEVVADSNHPFEGRYRLSGRVNTDTLVGDLRLFVTRDVPAPELVSALVVDPVGFLAPQAEATGRVRIGSGQLQLTLLRDVPGPRLDQRRVQLLGTFRPDSVTIGQVVGMGDTVVGQFRLERLPGSP